MSAEDNNIQKKTSTGQALKTLNNIIGAVCAFLCVFAFNSINTKLDKFQDFYEKSISINASLDNRLNIIENKLNINSKSTGNIPQKTLPVVLSFVIDKPEDQYDFTKKYITQIH